MRNRSWQDDRIGTALILLVIDVSFKMGQTLSNYQT